MFIEMKQYFLHLARMGMTEKEPVLEDSTYDVVLLKETAQKSRAGRLYN